MSNLLVEHALSNIWCTPGQDNQVIFKMARLTGYNGVINSWKLLMTSLRMPEQNVRFHLFQIGQIHPKLINLFPRTNEWTQISESCNLTDTSCHLYTDTGLRFALTQCYYVVTEERNVIVAIRERRQLGRMSDSLTETTVYGKGGVYINLYNNSFFSSERSLGILDQVSIAGGVATSTQELLTWQMDYLAKKNLPGHVLAYRNGFLVEDVSLVTCAVGDLVEYVHDASVYRVVDYPLNTLQSFDSNLDQSGKYILHHTLSDVTTIDYVDDIDFYLVDTVTNVGVYFHKNNVKAVRMLTHRDYSVLVSQIEAYLRDHAAWMSFETTKLQAVIRHAGYARPLVDEHSRIKELYKLPHDKILQAMTGVNATVSVWRADALESSQYAAIMGAQSKDITASNVAAALGYNATAKLFAYPVVMTTGTTQKSAVVPYIYQVQSVAFEYDAAGHLLGYKNHANAVIYNCTSTQASQVEFIRGVGGMRLDDHYDQVGQVVEAGWDYRHYICPRQGNVQENAWIDVTGDSSKYTVVNDVVTWFVSTEWKTLTRSNKQFLLQTKTFTLADGLMAFNITSDRLVNEAMTELALEVPMGELDIFLNGKCLIQSLDYTLDFPTVVVRNKAYINQGSPVQNLVVRHKGLCKPDLSFADHNELGFVVNERLSVDHQFDIRDDKCFRIQLDGALKRQSEVVFNEDTPTFVFSSPLNGKPYVIKDVLVPLKDLTGRDTPTYRNASLVVDTQISDYLSAKLTTPDPEMLNPIVDRYVVYSPFLCKLIADLSTGILNDPVLNQQYNDNTVMDLVANYRYLLDLDPIHPDHAPSQDFVNIHPHCWNSLVPLTAQQYAFVNRVIRLYAKDVVTLSGFVQIV